MVSSRLRLAAAGLALFALLVAATAGIAAPDPARLPLGDGKTAAKPQKDKVVACQNQFLPATGSGTKDGPWIHPDGTWDRTTKLAVAGSVRWPKAAFAARLKSGKRTITSNNLPLGHRSGTFPIATTDPAHQFDTNANKVTAKSISLTLPGKPRRAAKARCAGTGPIGILNDGVLLFGPLDAFGRDAVAHEMLDRCGGHPDDQGVYHRHEVPQCVLNGAKGRATLVGYALDGFGIYVERGSAGKLLTNASLDQCHGRTSRVPWNGRTTRVYHYVATTEFPYTLGCFRGKPVDAGVAVAGPGSGGVFAPR